ncbi:GAF domain-containing protein [Pseudoalteromonas maricaloris]|uniref:GAF domain-containing protein n=1 Tax=Pseudoalteromonas maricaloris TaxID=184924 RepID=A0A8I2H6Q7_9GAMM|nr:GAF domain-containing protein [Pseudoalteromonas maricaloris]NLR19935.1 GAF domain-containing protein [Pseudoalteromonas maricaloris]WOX27480.1 GAF domain-containing protein [Pseudoalteromonas maricaloris]
MAEMSDYISLSGLSISRELLLLQLEKLDAYIEKNSSPAVWSYQIPELGEGGACSLFGHLQEAPFLLSDYVEKNTVNEQSLAKLQTIVSAVVEFTAVDWFGIYQARATNEGKQLLKLAYSGAPSRPLFPITEAFAATSNNIQTVLSAKARVINDIPQYVASGGEYYTCDPKVKAETCMPLFDDAQNCIGIIDAEAFSESFFNEEILALLAAACTRIPDYLPE